MQGAVAWLVAQVVGSKVVRQVAGAVGWGQTLGVCCHVAMLGALEVVQGTALVLHATVAAAGAQLGARGVAWVVVGAAALVLHATLAAAAA
jgi:hypothetical protein